MREISSNDDRNIVSQDDQENISPNKEQTTADDIAQADALTAGEVLEVFGKRLYEERGSAPEVLPDIAIRWEEVLLKGIPQDVLKEMIIKHPPPKNCARFEPPKLNPVVKAIMPEQVIVRDDRIVKRQEKLSAALSAMAKVLSAIVSTKVIPEWKILAENLSDASKLIADLQHDEAIIRRSLIVANVDISMRETLKESEIDEFLFGNKLEDAVKNVKTMQATSLDLKKTTSRKIVSKNSKAPQPQRQLRTQRNSSAATSGAKKYNSSRKQSQHKSKERNRTTSNSRRRS